MKSLSLFFGGFAAIALSVLFLWRVIPVQADTVAMLGHVDGIFVDTDGSRAFLKGWALSENHDAPVMIEIWVDGERNKGKLHSSTPTNTPRSDVDAAFHLDAQTNHGFNISLSVDQFDGRSHTYYIYAQNSNGTWQLLNGSPLKFQDTINASVRGSFDAVITDPKNPYHITVNGWAIDSSSDFATIPVIFTAGPLPVTAMWGLGAGIADQYRSDLTQIAHEGKGAFNVELDLTYHALPSNTPFSIYAYAIDINDARPKLLGTLPYTISVESR